MKHSLHIPLLCLTILLATCCNYHDKESDIAEAEMLVEAAEEDVYLSRYDSATQKALNALEIARDKKSTLMEVRALSCLTRIDIMCSRDAAAWEKALEAESLARTYGYGKELASVLISKAKLCIYAEISPETGRNEEGLEYAFEALSTSELSEDNEQIAEACYSIASLYINKNRWSDPIDHEIYRTAGEYLDRGQALAEKYELPRLRRNGVIIRSRWFQQGNRNEEAIQYCEQVYKDLPADDHYTASAICDRLVRLYYRTEQYEKAFDVHSRYVYETQNYIFQKADEVLQEMETRFKVEEKDRALEMGHYRNVILVLLLLLAAAIISLGIIYIRKERRRSKELQRQSDTRAQIIDFLSNDLRNPASEYSSDLKDLVTKVGTLSNDEIRRQCEALSEKVSNINHDVAEYVGDVLIERSRLIADVGLSAREMEIVRLSAKGLKASEIAEKLSLSVHTVNNHRQRIYSKLEVRNVSEMICKVSDLGLLRD